METVGTQEAVYKTISHIKKVCLVYFSLFLSYLYHSFFLITRKFSSEESIHHLIWSIPYRSRGIFIARYSLWTQFPLLPLKILVCLSASSIRFIVAYQTCPLFQVNIRYFSDQQPPLFTFFNSFGNNVRIM